MRDAAAALPDGGWRRPRLVATDLDGTLLRSDGTGSERTAAALRAVQSEGIRTVLVTARPPRWLDPLAHLVGDGGVAICGNGAFVYDVPNRKVLSHRGIQPEAVVEIVADLRRELPGVTFAAERATGFALEDAYESQHPIPVDAVRGPIPTLEGGVVGKLLGRHPAMSEDEFLERVADVVGHRGIVAYSGAGGLAEISAPGVTKAAGLESWCEELGLDAADVWAFGDMPNDLPMLAWAGTAYGIRTGHPDVVAAAERLVDGPEDDGVARELERLFDLG